MSLRYVILRHDGIADPHFDLMFETSADSLLTTCRVSTWPMEANAAITRLTDHRRAYLEYEGPVSGGRGQVKRVAAGTCDVTTNADGSTVLRIAGLSPIHIPAKSIDQPSQ